VADASVLIEIFIEMNSCHFMCLHNKLDWTGFWTHCYLYICVYACM